MFWHRAQIKSKVITENAKWLFSRKSKLWFFNSSDIFTKIWHFIEKSASEMNKCFLKFCHFNENPREWAPPFRPVIFDQLKIPAKKVRLGILKLVKPDICLKTDNINYVPLNPFFMFCWIEFWDMFFGVYLVPPRRPCLAAIMSNHHQFPISPAPPPTPPNQPSAKTKKGWRKKH